MTRCERHRVRVVSTWGYVVFGPGKYNEAIQWFIVAGQTSDRAADQLLTENPLRGVCTGQPSDPGADPSVSNHGHGSAQTGQFGRRS